MTGENDAQKSIICCDPLHAGILAIRRLLTTLVQSKIATSWHNIKGV